MLKPQDVVLALKLLCKGQDDWSQGSLSQELIMSASEVNAGLKRLAQSQLIEKQKDGRKWQVVKPALGEFLLHGIKYVFPAQKGAPAIGIPTANATDPLKIHINNTNDIPPVWPVKSGKIKGYVFYPLYPTAPQAALKDAELYEWLSIVDALRDADNSELNIAELALKDKLSGRVCENSNKKQKPSSKDDHQLDLLSL